MKTPTYKLQAILDNAQKWPYVGNGFLNKDGSITLLLDRTVKLELADGTRLQADETKLVKLFLRPPFRGGQAADSKD